jgi:hypothetical protein
MNEGTQVPSMHVGQMYALFRRYTFYESANPAFPDFMSFLRTVEPTFLMDGAVVVKSCGMWLAAEANSNGELHS